MDIFFHAFAIGATRNCARHATAIVVRLHANVYDSVFSAKLFVGKHHFGYACGIIFGVPLQGLRNAQNDLHIFGTILVFALQLNLPNGLQNE